MRLSEWHAAAPTPASLAARVDAVVVPVLIGFGAAADADLTLFAAVDGRAGPWSS